MVVHCLITIQQQMQQTSSCKMIKLSIQEYHDKRDFAKTPEPTGNTQQQKKNQWLLISLF
jgi:hypothetical protein